jgi:glycosyltransferase involved in cell wall biosynthesis
VIAAASALSDSERAAVLSRQHRAGVSAIRVGLTEAHGMAKEVSRYPADGVEYSFLKPLTPRRAASSVRPISGDAQRYEGDDADLVEAVLSPIRTDSPWIYSLAHLAEGCGFDGAGAPPRAQRVASLWKLISRPNLKKLVFWSHAGHATLANYGGIDPDSMAGRLAVVHPAVRTVPDDLIRYGNDNLRLLFSGEFFRKGGVHAVDAFERARQRYPGITLTICCDEHEDFITPNESLRREYLHKINTTAGIVNRGHIAREELMTEVYPATDIFLLPTYIETFGMAMLEAMAFGIPVISTNHFAIPEMIQDGVSGLLIDTTGFDCGHLFGGYVVPAIPEDFRHYMTDAVFHHLCRLIESIELRRSIGQAARDVARSKFSFERRNAAMLEIYRQAIAD